MNECDKELLVAYLYDELGDSDRARLDRHLRGCAACREDLAGLRSARADLMSWAPPEPDLGFQIVRDRPAARAAGWRARFTPAFGLAAAATLVLAAAAGVANVHVHYGADGFTVWTGWSSATPPSTIARNANHAQQASVTSIDPAAVQAIERRISDLEQIEKSEPASSIRPASLVSPSANRMSDADLLKRFRELIAQSEGREQTVLARQIQQLTMDTDRKRANDMARVQATFNDIYYKTASDAAVHQRLADAVYRMSQSQQK